MIIPMTISLLSWLRLKEEIETVEHYEDLGEFLIHLVTCNQSTKP